MKPFTTLSGIVAPLDALNVDTDQIIPKQFLKLTEKTGFGKHLFYDWRLKDDGSLDQDFEMNAERYQGARFLLTRDNFGCGSSREHAPWALEDYGLRCILAPSFADIFFNNCFNNGMLPVVLRSETIGILFKEVRENEGYQLSVDLAKQEITKPDGSAIPFEVDAFKKHCLLKGLDQIDLTLEHEEKISAYENSRLSGESDSP